MLLTDKDNPYPSEDPISCKAFDEGAQVVEFIEKRRDDCQLNDEEVECRLCLSELIKALHKGQV